MILGNGGQKNVNVFRLKLLHDTFIWQDEDGEPFLPIPADHPNSTRNLSPSVDDEDEYLLNNLTVENSHLDLNEELESEPVRQNLSSTCDNPAVDNSHCYVDNAPELEPIEDNLPTASENSADEHTSRPDAVNIQQLHIPQTRRVRFQDPLEILATRALRPNHSLKKPAWMINYDLDTSE